MFNSFLCTFLNIFQANIPVKYKSMKDNNYWITQGTKIYCKHKRSLYAFTKNSNDPKAKVHYTKHCTVLRTVTKEAQKQRYSRHRAKPNNKIKTTWNIIKKETGEVHSEERVPTLLVDDEKLKELTNVAKAFNNFFITITEKLSIQQIGKQMLSHF